MPVGQYFLNLFVPINTSIALLSARWTCLSGCGTMAGRTPHVLILHKDSLNHAVILALDLIHQLHSLDNAQHLALFHGISYLHKGLRVRGGRRIKGSPPRERSPHCRPQRPHSQKPLPRRLPGAGAGRLGCRRNRNCSAIPAAALTIWAVTAGSTAGPLPSQFWTFPFLSLSRSSCPPLSAQSW